LNYGINANLTTPTLQKKKNGFSPLPGYGFGLFLNVKLPEELLTFTNRLQFNRYLYYSSGLVSNISTASFEGLVGFEYRIPALRGITFISLLNPSYSLLTKIDLSNPGPGGSLDRERITEGRVPIDLGYTLGLGLDVADNLRLELSYTFQTFSKLRDNYYYTRPGNLNLGLFVSLGQQAHMSNARLEVVNNLNRLKGDTLYVINRACSDIMTDSLLDSLFRAKYLFSDYRIIREEEVAILKESNRAIFYAIVGEFYAGEGEPLSHGIFLLDSTFNLVKYPYPVLTDYPRSGGKCFESIEDTGLTIKRFSDRLRTKLY
jgi:hypothetical protein